MATPAYRTWNAAGRPFTVARPIRQMVAYAKAKGIAVLGTLGNDDHLLTDWPEDHTPFSFTGQPLTLPLAKAVDGQRYWVCACDLANSKGLGAAILRDARAGRTPWLKYMNFAGRNYNAADRFQQGWPNADEHIHLSCWTDELLTDISGYDPLATPPPPEDDMLRFIREKGTAPVYATNGVTMRWLRRPEALTAAQVLATDDTVHEIPVGTLSDWGVVVLDPADVAALKAQGVQVLAELADIKATPPPATVITLDPVPVSGELRFGTPTA